VPGRYRDHRYVFHNPVVFAPRLRAAELEEVAREIGKRLAHTRSRAVMLLPQRGVSRYSAAEGPLFDPEGDRAFLEALKKSLPTAVEVVEVDANAEDESFVRVAVERLVAMIEA